MRRHPARSTRTYTRVPYSTLFRSILAVKPIDVFNHGHHTRDFTNVDDIVEGVIRTLDRVPGPDPDYDPLAPSPATSSAPYRVYNIGNNRPVEIGREHV